jgi:hypothetical protein
MFTAMLALLILIYLCILLDLSTDYLQKIMNKSVLLLMAALTKANVTKKTRTGII